MVTGIVVPRRTGAPMRTVELRSLHDYQLGVGGYIETIHLDQHALVLVVNEEGKVRRLNVNRRATYIWWLLSGEAAVDDALHGDVLIVGGVRDGEFTDAPPSLVSLLLATARYQVQVLFSEASDTWIPVGEPVTEFFEATTRALQLIEVWSPSSGVRVVPAD